MRESKKRKHEFDLDDFYDMTPTPPKFHKTSKIPFQDLTEAVMEHKMMPFLTNYELGDLSLVSQFQRKLTEQQRQKRHARREQEKKDILAEIASFDTEQKSWKYEHSQKYNQVTKLVDRVWSIPFDEKTWNRLEIVAKLSDGDVEKYILSKLSARDRRKQEIFKKYIDNIVFGVFSSESIIPFVNDVWGLPVKWKRIDVIIDANFEDDDLADNYVASKLTLDDFKVIEPDDTLYEIWFRWLLMSNISSKDKKIALEKLLMLVAKKQMFQQIFTWAEIIRHVHDLNDFTMIVPFVKKFYDTLPDITILMSMLKQSKDRDQPWNLRFRENLIIIRRFAQGLPFQELYESDEEVEDYLKDADIDYADSDEDLKDT